MQLCLYCAGFFFNLNEIAIMKKENISSLLIAKMYNIKFYQKLLQGFVRQSGNNLFEHEKLFQIIGIVVATEQSIKSFTFIFQDLCLTFKTTFRI